jgi:hypothetical protein
MVDQDHLYVVLDQVNQCHVHVESDPDHEIDPNINYLALKNNKIIMVKNSYFISITHVTLCYNVYNII